MDSAVHLHPASGEGPLEVDAGSHRVAGPVEDGHGGVALDGVADAAAAVPLDRPVDDEQVFGQQARRRVRRLVPQPGRRHDIGRRGR